MLLTLFILPTDNQTQSRRILAVNVKYFSVPLKKKFNAAIHSTQFGSDSRTIETEPLSRSFPEQWGVEAVSAMSGVPFIISPLKK